MLLSICFQSILMDIAHKVNDNIGKKCPICACIFVQESANAAPRSRRAAKKLFYDEIPFEMQIILCDPLPPVLVQFFRV